MRARANPYGFVLLMAHALSALSKIPVGDLIASIDFDDSSCKRSASAQRCSRAAGFCNRR